MGLMKMMKLLLPLIMLFLAGCATEPPIRAGVSPDYPPVVFMKNGRIDGIESSLAEQIEKKSGRKIQFEIIPFDRLIESLNQNKIDVIMSGMSVTEARKKRVSFTTSYLKVGQMMLIRENDVRKFNNMRDAGLYGMRIGVQKGTTGEAFAKKNLKWQSVTHFGSVNEAIAALEQGAIDCVVHDAPTIWHYSADLATQRKGLIGLFEPLTDESLAWAVRKDDTQLLQMLDKELERMRQNGILQDIINRWVATRVLVGGTEGKKTP